MENYYFIFIFHYIFLFDFKQFKKEFSNTRMVISNISNSHNQSNPIKYGPENENNKSELSEKKAKNEKTKSFCLCFWHAIKDFPLAILLLIAFIQFALTFYKPQNSIDEGLPEQNSESIYFFALILALNIIWLTKALHFWKESKINNKSTNGTVNIEFIHHLIQKNRRIALYLAIISIFIITARINIHKYALGPIADRQFKFQDIPVFLDYSMVIFETCFIQIPWGLPLALTITAHYSNLAYKVLHIHMVNFAVLNIFSISSAILFKSTIIFTFAHLLWANLLLSTVLSFVMAKAEINASTNLSNNRILIRNIIGITFYQIIVLLGLKIFGYKFIPNMEYDPELAKTMIFNTFVLMMLSNALFANSTYSGSKNILLKIFFPLNSLKFVIVWTFALALHLFIIQFGGSWFQVKSLDLFVHGLCFIFAFLQLLLAQLLVFMPTGKGKAAPASNMKMESIQRNIP